MILYHQSNNQIVFAISQNIAGKISDWFAHAESFHEFSSNIKLTNNERTLDFDTLYTLCFDFNFINDSCVCLRVHTENFIAFFTSAQASDLASLENQNRSWNTTSNGETIFSISGDIYQHLVGWKNWSALEALTPRYSYDFRLFCHGLTDLRREYFRAFDRQTKSLLEIIRDEDDYRGDEFTNSRIEENINILNEYIERDYRIMRLYESIRTFYPEYGQTRRTFYSESGGLACECFLLPGTAWYP
jgi:hypothetical protein